MKEHIEMSRWDNVMHEWQMAGVRLRADMTMVVQYSDAVICEARGYMHLLQSARLKGGEMEGML